MNNCCSYAAISHSAQISIQICRSRETESIWWWDSRLIFDGILWNKMYGFIDKKNVQAPLRQNYQMCKTAFFHLFVTKIFRPECALTASFPFNCEDKRLRPNNETHTCHLQHMFYNSQEISIFVQSFQLYQRATYARTDLIFLSGIN